MPRSKKNGRSSASPSPTNERAPWMNWQWQSVSDISMSGEEEDVAFEYSESEEEHALLSPTYATGTSMRHAREMSQSSRIVRFQSSRSSMEDDDEQPPTRSKARKQQQHVKKHVQNKSRVWNAVSNLAHSVSRSNQPKRTSPRSRTKEYPHSSLTSSHEQSQATAKTETSPLLAKQPSKQQGEKRAVPSSPAAAPARRPLREERAIDIAASFLRDCERGRRPSLPADLSSITDTLLMLMRWKYSVLWQVLTHLACISLFLSSCWESRNRKVACMMNGFSILVFCVDIIMGSELRKFQYDTSDDPILELRHSRIEEWILPMLIMLFLLGVEMLCTIGSSQPLWSGVLKPISLFYLSTRAKNALEALNRIFRIVLRVLVMELFLILSFATVACQLYSTHDSFHDLSTSFLSLFQCK